MTTPLSADDLSEVAGAYWVVYGGADRTRDRWAQLHERAGLTIERTIDLDDRFAMFVGATNTDRQTQ